ncbi:Plastocyanin protein [Marine Group I thaumarchaeote SCGC AAA799-E16]|uniref:Plastocyanin protein n=4 Tax=Marine Group I TaxID=905826 RepID=A0A081RMA7_9ARCH|nr:Plastocyanin protein [Marine Group I thaumarchaeote SCGC AAA799-N04]KER06649.1 Plastocyanin protein [Marine Group I thaumarchaeote SCGC AAA799-E16]KFM16126.1 Plastocyanin protein [Marine Group I thaumarchaeote SCGC AAA799-D11]KFM17863.1 Plastocyanin protein [Marine Group I thaumarchaeote SCGC RSA3]
MAGIDKAAIGFSIAIVAIGVAFAMYGDAAQNAGPSVSAPAVTSTAPEPVMDEPKATPEKPMKAGWERATSVQDPGMGHESHQLAVLLAPSENTYSGTLLYDASENIQLVTLRGPIGADEKPAKTWTPDGETIFELTFVDPKNAKGEWEFSGNALAVHTMFTNTFVVDYKILDLTETEPMMEEKTVELEEEVAMEDTTPAMDEPAGPMTHTVEMPAGTSVPGCEETNECYSPADITINAGDTVEWVNVDTAAHTVTGGSPADGPSGVFDSSLVMGGASYSFTFEDAGSYDYFCMVHPWMVGSVTVN